MSSRAVDLINVVNASIGYPPIVGQEFDLKDTRQNKVVMLLNRVLKHFGDKYKWRFLRKEGEIITIAPITNAGPAPADANSTGTVAVTNGSDLVDFTFLDSAGVPITSPLTEVVIGRAFQSGTDTTIYRIVDFVTSTRLKLNRAWLGTTATGKSYTIAQDTYNLPYDWAREVGELDEFLQPYSICHVSDMEFRERRRGRSVILCGPPEVFTLNTNETDGRYTIHFDPYPEDARVIAFPYQYIHPKITEPHQIIMFPSNYEEYLVEAMIYLAQRDYNSDPKMQLVLNDFFDKQMSLAAKEQGPGADRMRMQWGNRTRKRISNKFASNVRIDWGELLDRGITHDLKD